MVDQIIRPADLPNRASPNASEKIPVDNGSSVAGATVESIVLAGRPTASQAEAEAGTDAVKAMTPLTTAQAIVAQVPGKITDAIADLNLGSAAQAETTDFATSAQGLLADSAVQSIGEGSDISVDVTDPQNPVVSYVGAGVSDGDKGDVTVSNAGSTWSLSDTVSQVLDRSVANRTELKALLPARNGLVTLLEAGRQGTFELVAGTAPADPQEGLYVVSDTSGYYWSRIVVDDTYLATWWGVVADDSTDNQPGLQAAVVALPNRATTLILPAGVIRLAGQVSITRGYLAIRGAGAGVTTIRQTNGNVTTFYCAVAAPTSMQSLTIADMGIGLLSGVTSTSGAAIYIEYGDGIWLQNLSFSGHFYEIYLAGCFGVHMDNCRGANGFTTPNDRINIVVGAANASWGGSYGGNIFMSNCDFRTAFGQGGTPGAKYGIEISAVDGLFVSNSYFGYYASAAIAINDVGLTLAGIKFSNCWFDHEDGVGVHSFGGNSVQAHGGHFVGCTFVGGNNATYSYNGEGTTQGTELIGCEFAWVNGDNIRFATAQGGCVISGCRIRLADNDDVGGGAALTVESGKDYVITGNMIDGEGKGDQGVLLTGGSEFVVSTNRIKGTVHGIMTAGTVDGYIITGNNVRGVSGSGILDGATGTDKIVLNNLQ